MRFEHGIAGVDDAAARAEFRHRLGERDLTRRRARGQHTELGFVDGVEEDVLDLGRGEFGEVRPQKRRHACNNRRRHARPAVVDVVVVGAEAEDILAGGEQVDTTLADVREFCDEQVVVGSGTRPYVDEDRIHIAVPARIGVEGKRIDIVGFVAGGVYDEYIVGCGVAEGLPDAFWVGAYVFAKTHVDDGRALIDGVANGVGDVFVDFIAIRNHAHRDDVDQAVGDSDRAAFSRGAAADDAGDVRAVVLVSPAGVVVAVARFGLIGVAGVVVRVGPELVVVPSFLHVVLEVPEREFFAHQEFQELPFRTVQANGFAVKPDLLKVVRVFLKGVVERDGKVEVELGIKPRIVRIALCFLRHLSGQVHIEFLQPRGHRQTARLQAVVEVGEVVGFVTGEVQRPAGGVDHEVPSDHVVDVAVVVVVNAVAFDLVEVGVDGASQSGVGGVDPAIEDGNFDALRRYFFAEHDTGLAEGDSGHAFDFIGHVVPGDGLVGLSGGSRCEAHEKGGEYRGEGWFQKGVHRVWGLGLRLE